jgi:transcriptional regulator with XRE-family HTH domain
MAEIGDALAAAERSAFTRNPPKSLQSQIGFLAGKGTGRTRRLAERLGVSERQARRYLRGEVKNPPKVTKDRIQQQVEQRWQPRVRQQARRAAAQHGVTVELRARFGYTAAPGSTDDARLRRVTQTLDPEHSSRLLDARTEAEQRQALADALGYSYFRERGTRAQGLEVELTDIDYVQMEF